jgi:hypothetical protein
VVEILLAQITSLVVRWGKPAMYVVKLSAKLQRRHQPLGFRGLHLKASEMKACKRGRDCWSAKVGAWSERVIELNYKKGMELHTSVPSDDRIELGLDFSLLLGEAHGCHQRRAYCCRSLILDFSHCRRKYLYLQWWIQLKEMHRQGKPPQSLLCHRNADFLTHISRMKGRCPYRSAVERLRHHGDISKPMLTICCFTRFN